MPLLHKFVMAAAEHHQGNRGDRMLLEKEILRVEAETKKLQTEQEKLELEKQKIATEIQLSRSRRSGPLCFEVNSKHDVRFFSSY